MTPLQPLPILENWDCHCTGDCCRRTIVALTDDDVKRLKLQAWDKHPDYRGQKIVDGHGLLHRHYTLAKRPDGACIFLGDDGLCRIHRELGEPAKPIVCRMFPMQVVRGYGRAWVTLRRYCPSAALDKGRSVEEQLPVVARLVEEAGEEQTPAPPALVPGVLRTWAEVERLTDALRRLLTDERFPPVRRLVHGLVFCDMLRLCRLRRVKNEDFGPLVSMLEQLTLGDDRVGAWFQARRPPGRAGGLLFRQVLLEHMRLYPDYVIEPSWAERWRLLRAAVAFGRGKGPLPWLHACFPATTFEDLERPLGHLDADLLRPLNRYFEAAAVSQQYCLTSRAKWSIIESFGALALSYAVAMWMLRLRATGGVPTQQDVVDVVGIADRAQGSGALCGSRHRRHINSLNRMGELTRLLIWYAR